MQVRTLLSRRRDRDIVNRHSGSLEEDNAIGIASIWLVFYLIVLVALNVGNSAAQFVHGMGRMAGLE